MPGVEVILHIYRWNKLKRENDLKGHMLTGRDMIQIQ